MGGILLEIVEPGLPKAKVDISKRLNEDGRITIGRSVDSDNHHIALRKAPGVISRRHCTLEVRDTDGGLEVWIRDGAARGQDWKPSNNKTYIGSRALTNWVELSPEKWTQLFSGDVIRFCSPGNVEAGGFLARFLPESTEETLHGAMTCGADVVNVWRAASQVSDDGVLFLRQIAEGLLIVKADETAEAALGYQPGDLRASEGGVLLNSMILEREMLLGQANTALAQDPPTQGFYKSGDQQAFITMARRYIAGEYFLLAWIKPPEKPEIRSGVSTPTALAKLGSELLSKSPILFSLVVCLVAIAIIVITLM